MAFFMPYCEEIPWLIDLSHLNICWYDYTTLLIGWLRVYLNSVRFDLFVLIEFDWLDLIVN